MNSSRSGQVPDVEQRDARKSGNLDNAAPHCLPLSIAKTEASGRRAGAEEGRESTCNNLRRLSLFYLRTVRSGKLLELPSANLLLDLLGPGNEDSLDLVLALLRLKLSLELADLLGLESTEEEVELGEAALDGSGGGGGAGEGEVVVDGDEGGDGLLVLLDVLEGSGADLLGGLAVGLGMGRRDAESE